MPRVFQAYPDNTAKYFLAQEWSSGTPQIDSPVECDVIRFDTTRIFHSMANFDKQALLICIWSHSRHASEPCKPTLHYLWICGCQHTECHLSETKHLGAGAAQSAPTKLNIWIYAWSVCEGCRFTAITAILCVHQSFGEWCPPHAYRRYTALGNK